MKHNNKGVTLVELLVSAAIFSIVSLAAATFIMAGMRFYKEVNHNIQLQYDSQLALSLVNEYAVDCQKGIVWNEAEKTLYLANTDTVHVFRYDVVDKSIYYGSTPYSETVSSSAAAHLMAENVTDLQVMIKGGVTNATQLELTLQMERQNKSFRATQATALRNRPAWALTWTELWTNLHAT